MPTRLNAKFYGYIDDLALKRTSRNNYRQYVRWIEKYGTGSLTPKALEDSAFVTQFLDDFARRYDADPSKHRQPFNKRRKSDLKTVLRHYRDFLQSVENEDAQSQGRPDRKPRPTTRSSHPHAGTASAKGKVWIFQAVPERYDLTVEVPRRMKEGDWWRADQFRHEMSRGDIVLLWQSGMEAGIYATGCITHTARKVRGEWRVDVKYERSLKSPLLKLMLTKDKLLRGLSIIRQPRGRTNFRVTEAEWNALQVLLSDEPSTIPPEFLKSAGSFDPKSVRDARQRIMASVVQRRGQPAFRRKLLALYDGRCAISGFDAEDALEAAHVCPYKGARTNHPTNGVLLRADLHTLFDLHLLTVDTSSMKVLLAPRLKKTCYRRFHNSRVMVPNELSHRPSKRALDAHRRLFERALRGEAI